MLTIREIQVFQLIASGLNTCEISKKLSISETTVIFHKNNLKNKLHAKNSWQMIHLGIKKGLLDLDTLIFERENPHK
jgi:DNA-binding NarL/FixJ family response regulator